MRIATQVVSWFSLVKFSHTVFALPFALSMMVIAQHRSVLGVDGYFAIFIALISARTAAMAWNRYLDAEIDAKNPRTMQREIPQGKLSRKNVFVGIVFFSTLFVGASASIGLHCALLSPLVLALLFLYSWMKRITALCHVVLGLCLALAPGGVWYAMTGEFSWFPVPLMLGVLFWVTGFDILYSCQDATFDREHKLHSIPAVVGISRALFLAKASHAIAILFFAWFGIFAELTWGFWCALFLFASVLFAQYRGITPNALDKIDAAFFTKNGMASILFLIGVLIGYG